MEEILVENSTFHNLTHLKRRLVRDGLLEQRCAVCGLTDWLDKPISLVLDHVNGVNNDHRLENLRFLCPNCNSQQATFEGGGVGECLIPIPSIDSAFQASGRVR